MFLFLEYAAHNVLYHANAAEEGGVNQNDFLQNFQLANWIKLNNLFEKHQVRRHTPNASFLYILAESNMSSLIRVHPVNLSGFRVEDERYGLLIFAALATNSDKAVRTSFEVLAESSLQRLFHTLLKRYCQDGYK